MSFGCAILSAVNPDDIASGFGHHAKDDDFVAGLSDLLDNERWKTQGRKGYEYTRDTFETSRSIARHLAIYERLAGGQQAPGIAQVAST